MDRRPLQEAGFTDDQVEALVETFSPRSHRHEIEDIEDLQDELDGLIPDGDDDAEE